MAASMGLVAAARDQLPGRKANTRWPPLLAGPVVRRLTRSRVAIWIALGDPRQSVVVTLDGDEVPASQIATRQVLPQLGVALADLPAPAGTFVANQVYNYEVSVGGEKATGNFVGLPAALGTDAKTSLRLAHGSCRKLHGFGRDGFAVLSKATSESTTPPRPHLMLLTGDQIYADDVPGCVAPWLRAVADDLCGAEGAGRGSFPDSPIRGRTGFSKTTLGLTGDAMADHLWSFPEFCAMYLLAWSPALWPEGDGWWTTIADPTQQPDFCQDPLDADAWRDEIRRVRSFRKDLENAQRVLRTVPSYMVFDDHEVTDDWNLDAQWCQDVYSRPEARQLVTNGLAAYLVFQHWGNVPERFATAGSPEARALDGVCRLTATDTDPDPAVVGALLGVPAGGTTAGPLRPAGVDGKPPGVLWNYSIPDLPVSVHVLEERTERGSTAGGRMMRIWHELPDSAGAAGGGAAPSAPAPGGSALFRMLPLPAKGDTHPLTLVVAPGPVLGFDLVEHFVQPLAASIGKRDVDTALDLESWSWHRDVFAVMLRRLADVAPAAVLSGDVHYGFARLMTWKPPAGETGAAAAAREVLQLTCSAFRNAEAKTYMLGALGDLVVRLGILGKHDLVVLQHDDVITDAPPANETLDVPWQDGYDLGLGFVAELKKAGNADRLLPAALAKLAKQPDGTTPLDPAARSSVTLLDKLGEVTDFKIPSLWRDDKNPGAADLWDGARSANNVTALRDLSKQRRGMAVIGQPQVAVVTLTIEDAPAARITLSQTTYGTHTPADLETWGEPYWDLTTVSHTFIAQGATP